jgi:hypothetical protein
VNLSVSYSYLSGVYGAIEQRESCGRDIILSRTVSQGTQDDSVSMQSIFPGKFGL